MMGVLANIRTVRTLQTSVITKKILGCVLFGIFFTTSHGKNACDGTGGTTKRKEAFSSLQYPISVQILTPMQLFKFCEENILSMKYFYVSSDEIASQQHIIENRFSSAKTIPGTRDNRRFIPTSKTTVME